MAECSECHKKDLELKDKSFAIEKLQDRVKSLENQHPSMVDMVRHCEGGECPAHHQEWEAIKSELVREARANIPTREQVRDLARKHGDWPPPGFAIPGLSQKARR